MMLSGLMSRWTMPSACASASASAIWTARSIARRGFSGRPAISVLQRLARHVLEDEKQLILILADLVQRGDVRVRERRGGARLLQKPGAAIRVAGDVGASTLIATVRPRRVSRAR